MLRVAIGQINPTVGALKLNKEKIVDYIDLAKRAEADIVVFPELAICGYPPEDLLYKEHFIQGNIKILKVITKNSADITGIIGFVDRGLNGEIYNAVAVVSNKKLIGTYYKRELPNYGVFDEKRYFTKGEINKIFYVNGVGFGVSICEDIWVDAGTYLKQGQDGAGLLINVSCSPFNVGKIKQREELLKCRAKQTGSYICYANIVGGQDELVFDGTSLIVDPNGTIIAAGKTFKEDLVICDLPLPKTTIVKQSKTAVHYAQKIKPKATKITALKQENKQQDEYIYDALVVGVRDYAQKNGFKKVIIGISGGIDSALVATIAADALGKENVIGVSMPSKYSSAGTKIDARRLAKNLGIEFKEIPIATAIKAYDQTLKSHFKGLKPDITEENIQARIRGNILMALSNKFDLLVLTTGNKSELAVGYCTLYGDMTGGFAVIKDVLKTKVYDLCHLRNLRPDRPIPESIIKRAPSAELRHNQKDQDSLPEYSILDEIIVNYVEHHQSIKKMSKLADLATIKKVIQLVDQSEYKRRQAPPGIKITSRAFGKDWRLPITNKYREF